MEEYEDDNDEGTTVQGTWVRKLGYVSEFDIDARWILYLPNDSRPQGSLRIVSHPDLPPGHLKSYVSIVTNRKPKTREELAKTLENYGLLNEVNLFFYKGIFYREQSIANYYIYNGVIYKTRTYTKNNNGQTVIHYSEPVQEREILLNTTLQKTQLFADEYNIVTYSNPLSDEDLKNLVKEVFSELDAYNINEHVQTWDTEAMDKMRNLETLYKVKVFEK